LLPLRRFAAEAQEAGFAADGADGADAQAGGLEEPHDLAPAKAGDAGQGLAGGAEQGREGLEAGGRVGKAGQGVADDEQAEGGAAIGQGLSGRV